MEERFNVFTTLIADLSRSIRKIKGEEMKNFELKSSNVSCLYYLNKKDGTITAGDIATISTEDKAAVSRSLEYLKKEGYISYNCSRDKKYRTPIFLTDKGKSIAEKIAEKIDEVLNSASRGLTEEDREVMYKSLKLISKNLQKQCKTYGDSQND